MGEFGERTFLLDALPPFVKARDPRQFVIGPAADREGPGEPLARGIFNANLAGVIAVVRKPDDYFYFMHGNSCFKNHPVDAAPRAPQP